MNASGRDETNEGGQHQEQLPVERVRDLVEHIKSHEIMRPHESELDGHVTAIEQELGREAPHPSRLASLLDGLRGLSAEATEGLMHSGAMDLLNEILGTGVPPVGR